MAFTRIIEIRLENAGFIDKYDASPDVWQELANEALEYVKKRILNPRADDVAPHLSLCLEANPDFVQVMSDLGLSAKHWYRDFADLILDRMGIT